MNEQQKESRRLRIERETSSEILQKKSDARKAIEIRLENQEIELSDKDHFERLFKELEA